MVKDPSESDNHNNKITPQVQPRQPDRDITISAGESDASNFLRGGNMKVMLCKKKSGGGDAGNDCSRNVCCWRFNALYFYELNLRGSS